MEQIISSAGCAALGFLAAVTGVGLVVLIQKTLVEPCLRALNPSSWLPSPQRVACRRW